MDRHSFDPVFVESNPDDDDTDDFDILVPTIDPSGPYWVSKEQVVEMNWESSNGNFPMADEWEDTTGNPDDPDLLNMSVSVDRA